MEADGQTRIYVAKQKRLSRRFVSALIERFPARQVSEDLASGPRILYSPHSDSVRDRCDVLVKPVTTAGRSRTEFNGLASAVLVKTGVELDFIPIEGSPEQYKQLAAQLEETLSEPSRDRKPGLTVIVEQYPR